MKNKQKTKTARVTLIGGQALLEGVMMRGKSSMAMAVRAPDGSIALETKRLESNAKWYKKTPVIRGLYSFFASMVSGVTSLTKSAEVSSPEEEMPGKGWMIFAVVLGLALGIAIFMLLPSYLTTVLIDYVFKVKGKILAQSIIEGVIRIAIFVLYLFLVSLMKDIRRTFMYHGAEHRTINCFESGAEMTVENIQKCSTRHNRCGTTFLFFVMVISIFIFSFANWLFFKIGISADSYGKLANTFIRFGIRLALLPLVAGLSYELLKFLAYLPDNLFTKILRAPGLALQRLTTYPPDNEMAEVALKSFMAVYEMDNDETIEQVNFSQVLISDAREKIKKALKNTNADGSEEDWILCDVLAVKRNELSGIKVISRAQYDRIKNILDRRANLEPLWYILGYTEFYGEKVIVNNNVLIPRPETELLCEAAIKEIGETEPEVLDLCTGSGVIALTLAKNTKAKITASDISSKALSVAKINIGNNAELIESDMFSNIKERKFDYIISNPPYIASDALSTLDAEVKSYEPLTALDGGKDGLDFYRIIAENAPERLNKGGKIFLEIGYDQFDKISEILKKSFKDITLLKDYNNNDRIIIATKK